MNKEEIIIDGVDVSGCEKAKYIKQKEIVLCATGGFCEICPNCYYKQIKRLKDEIYKLKQVLQETKEIAMGIMDDDTEESSAYLDARQILDLITETELLD